MPAIHFIERLENVHVVDKAANEWESGYWVVNPDTAQKLVGGQIFLHRGQEKPSHFGGDILSFRAQVGGELDGRLIFRFRFNPACKGIRAARGGWGNEKKIVW